MGVCTLNSLTGKVQRVKQPKDAFCLGVKDGAPYWYTLEEMRNALNFRCEGQVSIESKCELIRSLFDECLEDENEC